MNQSHVLACVTGQRTCERLIRHSAALAQTLGCPVSVIHVAGGQRPFMGSDHESQALEYLYQISKEHQADMTVLRAQDVIDAITRFVRKNHITHLVLGGPVATGSWDVPTQLKAKLPGVEFFVIPSDVQSAPLSQPRGVRPCPEV